MRAALGRRVGWIGAAGLGLCLACGAGCDWSRGQVFVVGEKSATADVDTAFTPTRVELPDDRMTERGRRELIRDLEAEQGFAHRVLPVASILTLQANGKLQPEPADYKKLIYQKGAFANVGDRVAVTAIEIKGDKILVDFNGGPYLKHRYLRHVQIGVGGVNTIGPNLNDGDHATGCRVTLVFEGGVPEVSAPQVKSLLYPIVDFGVKTSSEAYADTLPAPLKQAIALHEVLVGMNRQMVIASMGAPESKVRERNADGPYEEWIYGHQPQTIRFVQFVGDRVARVKIAKLGKPIEIHDQDELAGYLPAKPTKVIAQGDAVTEEATRKGPPTLKKPGETLPDEGVSQSGRVQYPTPKKTGGAAGGASTNASENGSAAPAAGTGSTVPATGSPQFR